MTKTEKPHKPVKPGPFQNNSPRSVGSAGRNDHSAIEKPDVQENCPWKTITLKDHVGVNEGADRPVNLELTAPAPELNYVFPSASWNEARLLSLISDQIEESHELEYKAGPALRKDTATVDEITKDVSAMANAAGGTIIYGIGERRHLPEKLRPVDRSQISKEWLEHIASKIRPRIPDLRIHAVPLSSGVSDVAYVVEVPQGKTAHQNTDCRYYRRYNFEAVPMLDHEIRDVMNRRSHPKVAVSAKISIYPRVNRDGHCGALIFEIQNVSDVLAAHFALVASVPMKIRGHWVYYPDLSYQEETNEGAAYRLRFSNALGSPLFPHSSIRRIFGFKTAESLHPAPAHLLEEIKFTVYADAMPALQGTFQPIAILEEKRRQLTDSTTSPPAAS